MADIALTTVIGKAIDIAGNLGSHLYWLREDISWIEREMRHIQSYLEDIDDAKQSGSRGLTSLINDIRDLAYDVEDILETFLPRVTSHQRKSRFRVYLKSATYIFRDGYVAFSFAMAIKKIKRRVADVNRARETYGITGNAGSCERRDTWDPRRLVLHVDEPNVVGFDRDSKVLKAKLLGTDLRCGGISIVGMPGLGKTTLAKKVFKSVQHRFECSALVYVSQEPTIRELLRDIARQVGLEKEKYSLEENVETNLYEFLRGKRYVIFLDDIWDTRTWDALKVGIPNNCGNGSRIILTSRNSGVGRYIGGESSLHELQPLDPENSWRLFSKMITAPLENSNEDECLLVLPELEEIGRQMVGRCGGVPLAIVVTAGMLRERERTRHAWSGVLDSMGQDAELSRTLASSYKDLPPDLKPCFLYFGLFPEDHEILAFELINLWVAERFIRQASGERSREVEDVGEDYLNNLVSRNLVQVVSRGFDGRIKICRIHDLLHNLCILVAWESNFFNTHCNVTSDSASRVRRVTTHRSSLSDYISLNRPTPTSSRAMLCFDRDQILQKEHLKSVLGDFRFLRVLTIECLFFPSSFPNKIGHLIHLSYLRLSGRGLDELPPTISRLKNLLTLDVRECRGLKLPTSIWKMEKLRHILVSEEQPSSSPAPLFRGFGPNMNLFHPINHEVSLPNLQTLYMVPSHCLKPHWLQKFTNLRKLGIAFLEGLDVSSAEIVEVLSDDATPLAQKLENLRLMWAYCDANLGTPRMNLSRYQNLCKLHVEGFMWNLHNPMDFPPNLTKLTLMGTRMRMDPMVTLKTLPKLKILKLGLYSYMGTRMDCSGFYDFPQLEVMQIEDLSQLEELIAEGGGMPKLKKLIIRNCNKLQIHSERLKWIWLLSV